MHTDPEVNHTFIMAVGVLVQHRGHHYGATMVNFWCRKLREVAPLHIITAKIHAENQFSKNLFEHIGFVWAEDDDDLEIWELPFEENDRELLPV